MSRTSVCFMCGCLFFLPLGCRKLGDNTAASTANETAVEDCGSCCVIEPSRSALLAANKKKPIVQLRPVKLDQLLDEIKEQKDKIVVLDLWATFCAPCKKEFPRLVHLQEKHAAAGLVCMSLSVDEKSECEAAFEFLKSVNAGFANFLIDEPAEIWQNHFGVKGVPAVFIWDRTGKQVARFDGDDPDNQFSYEQVENKVAELLQIK